MNKYEKVLYEHPSKYEQIRLTINEFRDTEYLHIRKYYLDFDGDWVPGKDGVSMELGIDCTRELFTALTEILSLAESKEILELHFKDILDTIYL